MGANPWNLTLPFQPGLVLNQILTSQPFLAIPKIPTCQSIQYTPQVIQHVKVVSQI